MNVRVVVRKGAYFDSVTLMRVASQARSLPGVEAVVVGMGTDFNVDGLRRLGLWTAACVGLTPADLVLAVGAADDAAAAAGIEGVERLLKERQAAKAAAGETLPATLESALRALPAANVVQISVPGAHAAREARIALEAGRHVMMFSDNVAVEDELALKEYAAARGLLVMGPDCGTAILNGIPLAFANAVRKGDIGVVAASGTGLQEVTSLIHRFGGGITQAIGVGGRDLSARIGGRMTRLAVEALAEDAATRVIVLVSKPPAPETLATLLPALAGVGKPVVVYFIGTPEAEITRHGFTAAGNLEECARQAVRLSRGGEVAPLVDDSGIAARASRVAMTGPFVRGLYSGGTLCDEAQRMLLHVLGTLHSNTPIPGAARLEDIHKSAGHTIVDMGDDDFTRGRAHPMIDPTARRERIVAECADPETGLLLLDVVLGYGSHPDMAGEMVAALMEAAKAGRVPPVAACLCGTDEDPQDYAAQEATLRSAGVEVFPSHAAMARFASAVIARRQERA